LILLTDPWRRWRIGGSFQFIQFNAKHGSFCQNIAIQPEWKYNPTLAADLFQLNVL